MTDSRMVKCPICGKDVDTLRARAVGIFGGVTHYFCSPDCKAQFNDPRKMPRAPEPPPAATTPAPPVAAAATAAAAKPVPVAIDPPAKRKPAPEPEPEPEPSRKIKRDPSPSVLEDAEAWKGGGGRVWLVVVGLFLAAGVVLYFAFVKK